MIPSSLDTSATATGTDNLKDSTSFISAAVVDLRLRDNFQL